MHSRPPRPPAEVRGVETPGCNCVSVMALIGYSSNERGSRGIYYRTVEQQCEKATLVSLSPRNLTTRSAQIRLQNRSRRAGLSFIPHLRPVRGQLP
jgi:hypothetical protein